MSISQSFAIPCSYCDKKISQGHFLKHLLVFHDQWLSYPCYSRTDGSTYLQEMNPEKKITSLRLGPFKVCFPNKIELFFCLGCFSVFKKDSFKHRHKDCLQAHNVELDRIWMKHQNQPLQESNVSADDINKELFFSVLKKAQKLYEEIDTWNEENHNLKKQLGEIDDDEEYMHDNRLNLTFKQEIYELFGPKLCLKYNLEKAFSKE